ncbi:MAG: tetratricopeptide repeat protein [Gammaproteobacteria bacterium]|nr:tetratricopeptide repeat protein [Gammaproteobacteria bacterium]
MNAPRFTRRWLPALALPVLLSLIWLAYRPGLTGGFLFDDYANLPALGASGPIDNAPALWRYLTAGGGDPTGRPLTVASFLLDAQNWPADPRLFKRTNLLLHLLNVVLLAALLLALGRRAGLAEAHAERAALLGAAFWGLHSLLVSTTLYVVQREAMLPATFIMTGLLVWLAGRQRLAQGKIAGGVSLELLGLGFGTMLATLCKANGALLPVYALLIEYLLLRPAALRHCEGRASDPTGSRCEEGEVRRSNLDVRARPGIETAGIFTGLLRRFASRNDGKTVRRSASSGRAVDRRILLVLGWLPALAVLGYLAWTAARLLGGPPPVGRQWTEAQRLLTEPRVLWDYLRLLWLPRPFTPGLFNDQIHASTGWLTPWTTLPALLGLAGLLAGAWALRRRAPLWSFALLFFFAGHLLESTTIPLELYFEHRNYLPALPLFWPLATALTAGGRSVRLRTLATAAMLALLCLFTHSRARLWGNVAEQGLLWARLNPDSPRAQSYAAQILNARGLSAAAVQRLRPALRRAPDQIQIAFNLINADCRLDGVPQRDLEATAQALRTAVRLGELPYQWLTSAIAQAHQGGCPGLTPAAIDRLLDAAQANPRIGQEPGWQQDLLDLRGRAALAAGDAAAALRSFLAALYAHPDPQVALSQAALLAAAGHPQAALAELDAYRGLTAQRVSPAAGMPWLHQWVLDRQHYWPHEFAHLRATIEADVRAANREQ